MTPRLLSDSDEVVDAHCHIPAPAFVPPAFCDATVDVLERAFALRGLPADRARLGQLVDKHLDDPDCEQMAAAMDAAGICRALIVVPDFSYALAGSTSIENLIAQAERVVTAHAGRFSLLVGVDPRWGDDGVRLFEAAVARGVVRGLKVYPPCGYSPSDPGLYPLYEICAARRLPVMVHTGGSIPPLGFEHARPLLVDQAARDFPALDFVLAHGLSSMFDETVLECLHRPNVYADISALGRNADYLIDSAVARGIAYKLIFGSDWPVFQVQDNLRSLVDRLLAPDGPFRRASSAEVKGIFGGTITTLLERAAGPLPVGERHD